MSNRFNEIIVNKIDDLDIPSKKIIIEQSASLPETSTTLRFTRTIDNTLVFPNIDDTLVGRTTVDVLENKTLIADNTRFADEIDSSKILDISLSALNSNTSITFDFDQSTNTEIKFPLNNDRLIGEKSVSNVSNKNLIDSSTSIINDIDNTKQFKINLDNSTNNTTTTFLLNQSENRNILIPDANDTLVGKNTIDILNNKQIVDNKNIIINEFDNTRSIKFNLDNASTNTETLLNFNQTVDRTINFSDANDTLMGKNTNDIVNNKLLIDNTNKIVNNIDNTKQLSTTLSAASTNTNTTLNFVQSDNRIITFPDATDTLMGINTNDVVNNKLLTDNTNYFVNNIDNTKQLRTSLSGASTNTNTTFNFVQTANRIITFPDTTDTLIGQNNNVIINNKSLVDNTTKIVNNLDTSKTFEFNLSEASTATNTTLKTNQTLDREIYLPDANDILIGKNTVDILNNKSLVDISTTIINDLDNSKKMVIDLDNASTNTTTVLSFNQTQNRIINFPDADDTLIGKFTNDVLNNKTLIDTTTTIQNGIDNTKNVLFNVTGNTNSNTTFEVQGDGNSSVILPITNSSDYFILKNNVNNIGNNGIGVYNNTNTINGLDFKKLASESGLITITDNTLNNTIDLDISTGTSSATVAIGDDPRFADAKKIIVKTENPGFGEFTSVAAAVNSITDASETNRYVISVGPGIFTEPIINIGEWISVVGSDSVQTIVQPIMPIIMYLLSIKIHN